MVVITLFAVLISILYDRIELGIIATIGGFITPFLVSQGDGNWLVLFSYLTILNVGLIILAYYKRCGCHALCFLFYAGHLSRLGIYENRYHGLIMGAPAPFLYPVPTDECDHHVLRKQIKSI
jgi:hypothetical protein